MAVQNKHNHTKGFSLVELSVALIIIGFLVAGITGARTLINNARISSVISEVQKIKTSTAIFQAEFEELPGDFSDAETVWGRTENQVMRGTRNGNGDGIIFDEPDTNFSENLLFWRHLTLAQMYPGTYSERTDANSDNSLGFTPGFNTPQSQKIKNAVFTITSFAFDQFVPDGNSIALEAEGGSHITPGRAFFPFGQGLLTPTEAEKIDKKMDDGAPRRGLVQGMHFQLTLQALTGAERCWTGSAFQSADTYNTAITASNCAMLFSLN